jgi:hypothetical protein
VTKEKVYYAKGWSTPNVLSSVLHDKVRLTDKTDAKQAATLLMLSLSLFLSLSKNTMDEALMITINSIVCAETEKKEISDGCASICNDMSAVLFENKVPARPSCVRSSNLIQFMQNVKSAVHT